MIDVTGIRQRYLALSGHLDERARRIFSATEARTAGYGGIAAVSRATGIAASTIGRGLTELISTDPLAPERVRRPGGGGKKLVDKDPTLLPDLMAMVEPGARGDPMSPLRWICKSLSQLASALVATGHEQMEQDRAPLVLVHHDELEGHAAGQLPRHHRSDRGDHHEDRPDGEMRTRQRALTERSCRLPRADGQPQHYARCVPRRLELRDPPHRNKCRDR